jgi:GrpB-like predicted nucleotidyltransferase (UPF0157 family)
MSRTSLERRLTALGIEDTDPFLAWQRLRAAEGRRTTVIDLYELVARTRGLQAYELPPGERAELAHRALGVAWPGFETVEGSEREGEPIEVVPYDPAWPARFAAWRGRIEGALGDPALRVEHVGSTSVPGLAAKPVVDIQVSVADIEDEPGYVPALERAGVQLRSRDAEHRYFRPFPGASREVHVHVCDAGGRWEREHLLFRDYLRSDPAACRRYAVAKYEAAARWPDDRIAYTDAKNDVILDVLEEAEAWARSVGWSVSRSS